MVLLHENTSAKSRDDVTLLHGLDCFSPRFRTPSSIAQSKCSFHHQKFNHPRLDTKEHDSTQTKFTSIYRKKVRYRPYPRTPVLYIETGRFFFYIALGASSAHIQSCLSQTLRTTVQE